MQQNNKKEDDRPIAVGGSAANPPSLAHRRLVEWLVNSGKFSMVYWILSGNRTDKDMIDPDHRVAMTQLTMPPALFLHPDCRLVISYQDVYHDNTPTIVWVDLLRRMYPKNKIVWYTGADSVEPRDEFDGECQIEALWTSGQKLMQSVDFLIFPRQGYADPAGLELPENFEVADVDIEEISSTDIRRRIEAREPFDHLMAREAADYLKKHRLYGYTPQ